MMMLQMTAVTMSPVWPELWLPGLPLLGGPSPSSLQSSKTFLEYYITLLLLVLSLLQPLACPVLVSIAFWLQDAVAELCAVWPFAHAQPLLTAVAL